MLIAMTLVCLLTASVSAVNATQDNPLGKYDTDPGVDATTHRVTADVSFDLADYFVRSSNKNNVILGDTTAKSVLYDSVTNGYYVFPSIYMTQDMKKFEYYVSDLNTAIASYASANSIETYPQFSMSGSWGGRGVNELVHYEVPQGVTYFDKSHCLLKNNKLLKTVWVASTITSTGTHLFGSNPLLEYIYNFENTKFSDGITFDNLFENSYSLKEVKLPNITATIKNLGQVWGTNSEGQTYTSLAQNRTFRIYIPNGNYTLASNFYQASGNTGKFEFVYCGTDYEAFLAKNTVLSDVTVVSSSEYTLGSFTNKYNFVCDYSYCDAYLNGQHTKNEELSNPCVTVCKDCGKTEKKHVELENIEILIQYDDFANKGTKLTTCLNPSCPLNEGETTEVNPIFTFKGYSTDNKDGICTGYYVDTEALNEYKANKGEGVEFNFGFVISAGNDSPLNENGELVGKGIVDDLTSSAFSAVDFRLTGKWNENDNATTLIAMNLYTILVDGEGTHVSYVYGELVNGELVSGSYSTAGQTSYSILNPLPETPQE